LQSDVHVYGPVSVSKGLEGHSHHFVIGIQGFVADSGQHEQRQVRLFHVDHGFMDICGPLTAPCSILVSEAFWSWFTSPIFDFNWSQKKWTQPHRDFWALLRRGRLAQILHDWSDKHGPLLIILRQYPLP